MKLKVSKSKETLREGGSGFITRSGIYDVTLNFVQIAENENGAAQLIFSLTHEGQEQTLYGPYILNRDGGVNEITQRLLNRLCVIAGMEDGQEIETETEEHPLGREQKMTEIEVIPELSGVDVKMRIQMEYDDKYNGEIRETKAIKAFYREDGATAEEATSGENIGRRLAIDTEKYADKVTYKNGLTKEDVDAWLEERRSGASDDSTASKKATPVAKKTAKRPTFAKN